VDKNPPSAVVVSPIKVVGKSPGPNVDEKSKDPGKPKLGPNKLEAAVEPKKELSGKDVRPSGAPIKEPLRGNPVINLINNRKSM